eukprot:CAMPEP_0180694760 /NCGR_PEP_ID=MMETSP1038_2-20121128/2088_1 /TAXON_ID=632150 /ORGANISM="Azadinium spinosum, Strain 3D9" /LENGTH=489 /DNA_ID=CAMNT_0022726135 /DNA_START=184 /DNA_END=1649 /DNA_ORIENTATION=-
MSLATDACEAMRNARAGLDDTLESPVTHPELVEEFMQKFVAGKFEDWEVIERLPKTFGELDTSYGLYVKMSHEDERKRSMSAMMSIYWLLNNRYESFVECQKEGVRMTPQTWDRWQRFVKWVDLSDEMVHAMMVFLAIRGLGKVKSFAKALPRDKRSPEHVMLHLVDEVPGFVPSVRHLSESMHELIIETLNTHSHFNLAQLLQGENTPSHIKVLKEFVSSEGGERLLKFYLLGLVGVMCAIRGTETLNGSLFLDEKQGSNVFLGVQCLRKLSKAQPQAIYWGFISTRADLLGLSTRTPDDLAIARLACLIRATPGDKQLMDNAWSSLTHGERMTLTGHFLADGIKETAFVFNFLPLYFAHSKANPAVGLQRALAVLVDYLELLRSDGYAEQIGSTAIVVDLQDLSTFVKEVKSPRIFLAVAENSKFICVAKEVQVLVSTKHWQRVNQTTWVDDPASEMSTVIKKMERTVKSIDGTMQQSLHQIQGSSS